MGWFSSAVHSITTAVDQVAKPVGSLFDSKSALVRALANPGDVVAVGQVFDNTAVKRQTPGEQLKDSDRTVSPVVHTIGEYHQELWYHIKDVAEYVGEGVLSAWRHFWDFIAQAWDDVGLKHNFAKLGRSIGHTVDKWGGERRVVAWAVVVVVVVIYIIWVIVTWGTGATVSAGWAALIMAILSWGINEGLTPDPQKVQRAQTSSLFNENNYNPISNSNSSSGSGQSGSFLDALANALSNLPVPVLIGAAAVGTLGVYYLFTRKG